MCNHLDIDCCHLGQRVIYNYQGRLSGAVENLGFLAVGIHRLCKQVNVLSAPSFFLMNMLHLLYGEKLRFDLRLQSELDFAPGSDEVPGGHVRTHCNCPCWLLCVPAGHGLQSVTEDLNVPLGHLAIKDFFKRNSREFLHQN